MKFKSVLRSPGERTECISGRKIDLIQTIRANIKYLCEDSKGASGLADDVVIENA